ncbi:Beta-glucanase [Arthrobotrys entomopaga]|nr:Beta-glucanase [Arthrobotrys entomopaga]
MRFYTFFVLLVSDFFVLQIDASPLARRNHSKSPTKPGFKKVWYEEFTSKNGLATNWIYDTGTHYPGNDQVAQWGTWEIETYTTDPKNINITNGVLYITPHLEAQAYLNLKAFGEFPSNENIPTHAFRDAHYKGWPATGELDIMESVNGNRDASGMIHCGWYNNKSGGPCNEPNGKGGSVRGVGRGLWNTFGIEIDKTSSNWKSQKITWLFNGARKHSITGGQVNNSVAWKALVNKKFFILLNVAVGGSMPDGVAGAQTPNSKTLDGDSVGMAVDWVAVYQQN